MCRSTDDGWMQLRSSGSITMRPASSSSRMVRSERIIGGTLVQACLLTGGWLRRLVHRGGGGFGPVGCGRLIGGGDPLLGRLVPLDPLPLDLVPLRVRVGTIVGLGLALGPLARDRHPPNALVEGLVEVAHERRERA